MALRTPSPRWLNRSSVRVAVGLQARNARRCPRRSTASTRARARAGGSHIRMRPVIRFWSGGKRRAGRRSCRSCRLRGRRSSSRRAMRRAARIGDRRPHRSIGYGKPPLEGEDGSVALDRESSVSHRSFGLACSIRDGVPGRRDGRPSGAGTGSIHSSICDQSVGAQRVDPALRIRPDFDEADLPQHPQMARHRRLRQAGRVATSSPAVRSPVGEDVEQSAAAGFGDGFEYVHGFSIAGNLYRRKPI